MPDADRRADLDTALHLVDSAQDDPQAARDQSEALVTGGIDDPEAAAVAWWALGLAARQLNDLATADKALRRGLEIATDARLTRRVGQIRSSLALVMLYTGDTEGALAEAEKATGDLSGADLARNEMQIGLLLQRLGHLDEALLHYRSALGGLRRDGDRLAEARLLSNRGVLHGYRGEIDLGITDLRSARAIAEDLGQSLIVGVCAQNLGFLEGRRGDIPAALAWFDQAERAYDALGRPPGMIEVLWANRAELLLAAGLFSEAQRAVNAAIEGLEKLDNKTDLSETRLLCAEVALANGHPEDALTAAETASAEFLEQDRRAWHLLAAYTALRARFEIDETSSNAGEAGSLAEDLRSIGLRSESIHCNLLAGRIALRDREVTRAREQLVKTSGARRSGSALDRAKAWHAEALLRRAEGNALGTRRAIDAGFRAIRDYRLTFGASDLKSHAATYGLDLALLAIQQGLDSGAPWRVLDAVESWRSESTTVAAVRPPSDPELRHLLSEMRRAAAEIRETALAGGDTRHLIANQARLEHDIKSASRRVGGAKTGTDARITRRDQIAGHLGDRRLLSFFRHQDEVHAISLHRGAIAVQRLIDVNAVGDELTSLLFALSRLAQKAGSPRALATAAAGMDNSLFRLRQWLLDPVSGRDEEIVVVPSAALHRLPWPALDPARTVTVVPSLEAWIRASSASASVSPDSRAVLVAGPDLPGANQEISRVARLYPNHKRRTGRNARAEKVLGDIEGADVAHVAAHGAFRHDNPSFSSLLMHDGPLTVYDFERIESPPKVMVLSSCDTAVSKVVAGDELLGLSSALIGIGVSSLVAPVVPIADEITGDLMVSLHRNLVAGIPPPHALTRVIAQSEVDEPAERALRASFVVFGA
jgi:CHAT domain-containing protein/tetratricopeptide (TPR) repeat protein